MSKFDNCLRKIQQYVVANYKNVSGPFKFMFEMNFTRENLSTTTWKGIVHFINLFGVKLIKDLQNGYEIGKYTEHIFLWFDGIAQVKVYLCENKRHIAIRFSNSPQSACIDCWSLATSTFKMVQDFDVSVEFDVVLKDMNAGFTSKKSLVCILRFLQNFLQNSC